MRKLFQHSEDNHFHLSVGAVLVKDGKILAHHLKRQEMPEQWRHLIGELDEAYIKANT